MFDYVCMYVCMYACIHVSLIVCFLFVWCYWLLVVGCWLLAVVVEPAASGQPWLDPSRPTTAARDAEVVDKKTEAWGVRQIPWLVWVI